MIRCLKDENLLLLYDGEGTPAERAHLGECEACGARYRQLRGDLEAIRRLLREQPPPKTITPIIHRFRPFTVRWLSTAVVGVLALVLVWEAVRIWSPFNSRLLTDEIWNTAEGLSPDPLLLNQALAEELWTVVADPYDRAAALEADRPCEWYDVPARVEVESIVAGFGDLGMPAPACLELSRL